MGISWEYNGNIMGYKRKIVGSWEYNNNPIGGIITQQKAGIVGNNGNIIG